MALSNNTIQTTMTWAQRMTYERPLAVANSLEPALTAANMIMQTILGPPFSWWWNSESLALTCSTTALTGTITNVAITTNVLTLTTTQTFPVGTYVLFSGLTTATFLNGLGAVVASSNGTTTTFNNFNHANYGSAADTGTITATTTQDYQIPVPEFSHIEHASVLDISQTPNKWYAIEVNNNLTPDSATARPRFICPLAEDGNGNVSFRVMPAPNQNYPINVRIQSAAPQLTGVNQSWAPIPDYMEYVYNWGFLALMYLFADDSRFQLANQKFTAGLLGRAEGLTEEEKNVFLNTWNNITVPQQMQAQQGIQARGV